MCYVLTLFMDITSDDPMVEIVLKSTCTPEDGEFDLKHL